MISQSHLKHILYSSALRYRAVHRYSTPYASSNPLKHHFDSWLSVSGRVLMAVIRKPYTCYASGSPHAAREVHTIPQFINRP